MTNTQSRLDQIVQKKQAAAAKIGGLARRFSGSRPKTAMANASTDESASSSADTSFQGPSHAAHVSAADQIRIQQPTGSALSYVSNISKARIIESCAIPKEDLETVYSTQSFMKAELRLRETSSDTLTAFFDTGATSSFITTYQAHSNFNSSDIKRMPEPMIYAGAGGSTAVGSYVLTDLFFSCTLQRQDVLAKTSAVLFITDELPPSIDLLIGVDFINAQKISFLWPSLSGVLGCCRNAQFSFTSRPNHDFPLHPLRRAASKNIHSENDLYVAVLFRPRIEERKTDLNVTLVYDDHFANSDRLITLEEARSHHLGRLPPALAATLQAAGIVSPGPSPKDISRGMLEPASSRPLVGVQRPRIAARLDGCPSLRDQTGNVSFSRRRSLDMGDWYLTQSGRQALSSSAESLASPRSLQMTCSLSPAVINKRRASLPPPRQRRGAMSSASPPRGPNRSTLYSLGLEQSIPPGPVACNWSRYAYAAKPPAFF